MSVPRRIWAAGLLGLGLIFLISVLLALLDAARIQEARGGVEFNRAATGLRRIVIGEVAAVALLTGLVEAVCWGAGWAGVEVDKDHLKLYTVRPDLFKAGRSGDADED